MSDDDPVVGGRYELGEVLGRGGMAEVRRGVDLRLGRPVAVKRLSAQLAADATFQERFRREAQAAASLNHPAIAAVFDSGEEPDPTTGVSIPYIVMELVEGSTLRDVLRTGPKLAPERALELTRGVLEALGHSHDAGIIHRDIKPANVMLTPTGAIKVMDFGIARAATDTSNSLTQTAAVIGTAQYLSPEQARGESVDLRSDLYSTGCLLYELLTGRPPFVGESSVAVAYQHVREPATPPSVLDPALGPEVDAVTLRALAKDPADRYQSAKEMAADITRVLGGGAPEAVPPLGAAAIPTTVLPSAVPVDPTRTTALPAAAVVAEPEPAPARRSAGRAVLIAALAFLVLAGLGYGVFRWVAPDQNAGTVTVPDVRGATRDEADRQLRAARIAPRFVDVEGSRDDTVDTVLSLDPPGGTRVQAGTTVTLEVNVGPMDAEIPDGLVGDDLDDVLAELKKAGFTRVRTERAEDPPARADVGEVVGIDPKEGTSVALGQEIVLRYVGDAPESTSVPPTVDPAPTVTREPTATRSPSERSEEPGEPTDEQTTDEPEESDEPEKTDEPEETDEPTRSTEPSESAEPTEPAEPSESAPPTSTPPRSADPTTSQRGRATRSATPDRLGEQPPDGATPQP